MRLSATVDSGKVPALAMAKPLLELPRLLALLFANRMIPRYPSMLPNSEENPGEKMATPTICEDEVLVADTFQRVQKSDIIFSAEKYCSPVTQVYGAMSSVYIVFKIKDWNFPMKKRMHV